MEDNHGITINVISALSDRVDKVKAIYHIVACTNLLYFQELLLVYRVYTQALSEKIRSYTAFSNAK